MKILTTKTSTKMNIFELQQLIESLENSNISGENDELISFYKRKHSEMVIKINEKIAQALKTILRK